MHCATSPYAKEKFCNTYFDFSFEAFNIFDVGQVFQAINQHHTVEYVVEYSGEVTVTGVVILSHNDQC